MLLCGDDGSGGGGGGRKVNSCIYNGLGDLHCRIFSCFPDIYSTPKTPPCDNILLSCIVQLSVRLLHFFLCNIQDWSRDLEESAREEAEKCEGIKERGTNTFHNITQLSNDRLEAFAAIVAPWTRENSVQQVGGSWLSKSML